MFVWIIHNSNKWLAGISLVNVLKEVKGLTPEKWRLWNKLLQWLVNAGCVCPHTSSHSVQIFMVTEKNGSWFGCRLFIWALGGPFCFCWWSKTSCITFLPTATEVYRKKNKQNTHTFTIVILPAAAASTTNQCTSCLKNQVYWYFKFLLCYDSPAEESDLFQILTNVSFDLKLA